MAPIDTVLSFVPHVDRGHLPYFDGSERLRLQQVPLDRITGLGGIQLVGVEDDPWILAEVESGALPPLLVYKDGSEYHVPYNEGWRIAAVAKQHGVVELPAYVFDPQEHATTPDVWRESKVALTPSEGFMPGNMVMLFRGIDLGTVRNGYNDYDAQEAAGNPQHALDMVETALQGVQAGWGKSDGVGLHWTTSLQVAKNFARSPGVVLIASVDPAYAFQSVDHDEDRLWSDWGVLPTVDNRESEMTIRPNSPIHLRRALIMGRNLDDNSGIANAQQVMAVVPLDRSVTAACRPTVWREV